MTHPHLTRISRIAACGAASLLLLAGQAQANNFSKAVYKASKDELVALYKAQKKACDSQSGNAKDVCVEAAKGQEKVALAQLEYNYTGSARDEAKLYEAQYKAHYEIAKEKCDDVTGNDKDVIDLNRKAFAELRCPRELVIVPGATHLFEEPGALEEVARLASVWFSGHFAREPDRR